ncbi:TPA: glycosyltransferase family A protein [Providencia alcalifaciens]
MDVNKPYFTVFTPTYNRADRLHRVYNSLKKQTFKDFEWLIIDDGSTDNTKEIIEKFFSEKIVNIRYFKQENGHKKIAFNNGVKKALGYFFIPADSDDTFDYNTLEIFKETYEKQDEELKTILCGVTCLCKDEQGNVIGNHYPYDDWAASVQEMRYKFRVVGEKWGCVKTSILRDYPFPEIMGHVPENVVWSPIAKKYKSLFINKPLRTYFTNESDSITHTKFEKENAHGAYLLAKTTIEHELNYFFYSPIIFIKSAANYTRFKLNISKSTSKNSSLRLEKNKFLGKLLITICSPIGFLLYLRDSKK